MPALSNFTQYSIESSSQSNQTKEIKKGNPNWKGRSKIITPLWCLFAMSFPLNSTTKQVSLNVSTFAPLVSEQRLDTEEICKHKAPV